VKTTQPRGGTPVSDHLDSPNHESWLTPAMQEQRRQQLGLDDATTKRFIESTEFVSLGCYCAVSRALQALGLKKHTYPFDWTRSSGGGVAHCLDNNFSDFFSHNSFKDHGDSGQCFGTEWGGSFWHHDPTTAKTKRDMQRRISRLLGKEEVANTKARFFVRAVNSSSEVVECVKLLKALRRALPDCKVHLLLLIDNQPVAGPVRVKDADCQDLLFFKIHNGLFADNGKNWTMQKQAESYARAVAFAVRFWTASDANQNEDAMTLADISASVVPFEGGDSASELFFPRGVISAPTSLAGSAGVANTSAPKSLPCSGNKGSKYGLVRKPTSGRIPGVGSAVVSSGRSWNVPQFSGAPRTVQAFGAMSPRAPCRARIVSAW